MHPLETDPDRLVLAGDWHGDVEHAESVIRWAARQDAQGVVQLGDFGIWPGMAGAAYVQHVARVAREAGVWVAFIDGNHEDFWALNMLPKDEHGARMVAQGVWHLPRGLNWTWKGQNWLALGGATSLDRPSRRLGISWWPEEEITFNDALRAMRSKQLAGSIEHMLTHDCPAGVTIPDLPPESMWPAAELTRANAHRDRLREVVDVVAPAHLWHGHFHVKHEAQMHAVNGEVRIHGLNDNTGPWPENVHLLDLALS